MFLKRIDEMLQSGKYDLEEKNEVEIAIIEPIGFENNKVQWQEVTTATIAKSALHYDDTADGSNKLNGSWREFYKCENSLDDFSIYSGSHCFFKNGNALLGGVAKSTIYMRYAKGFLDWLATFDSDTANLIRTEVSSFEEVVENKTTKKLPNVWHDFKAKKNIWYLIVVCRLSNGKLLVNWLNRDDEDYIDELEGLGIDVERSKELMDFLSSPNGGGGEESGGAKYELISESFQMGSGLGRNGFGDTFKAYPSESEYSRLLGGSLKSSRKDLLAVWENRLQYRGVKFAPNPDSSIMLFMPEGELMYSELKEFVDQENQIRVDYFEAQKKKTKNSDDLEQIKAKQPELVPTAKSCTIFLANEEGGQKKKIIIQQSFPAIQVKYLHALNNELLFASTQYAVVEYMKSALTGQNKGTPSVYKYWTSIFTGALQKHYLSAYDVFINFQRFAKMHSGEELINKGAARGYFYLISKLLRLQYLIHTARVDATLLNTIALDCELDKIEKFKIQSKIGVFEMEKTVMPEVSGLIGEVYSNLRDYERSKIESFAKQAWCSVPENEFVTFIKGALVGMLLNNLSFCVKSEGRSFSATQGRHPSMLRGTELSGIFTKGVGLLINLNKQNKFNCKLLPFVKSVEEESRKDTFNSGFIMGLVYFENKETVEDKEV